MERSTVTASKEKIIVTGGAGFIGSHLCARLLDEGYDVHVIDNNLTERKRARLGLSVTVHECNVCDVAACSALFADATTVFHLAALPQVQFSIENPTVTTEVNILGTQAVLKAAASQGVKRVVYSASSAIYGDHTELPFHEDLLPDPKSPYAMQKYTGELLCKTWSKVYGLETVSLRYFNVYGDGMDPAGPYASVIARFLDQYRTGQPLTVVGTGQQTRDYVHVTDVVTANVVAATVPAVGHGEVINVGSGKAVSVLEIAQAISDQITYVPAWLEPPHSVANIERAADLLAWRPTVDFFTALAELKAQVARKTR